MKPTDDPDLIARVELETWERCATGYVDGFGALVSEAITPLLDAACVGARSRVLDVGTGPGLVAAAVRDRQATAGRPKGSVKKKLGRPKGRSVARRQSIGEGSARLLSGMRNYQSELIEVRDRLEAEISALSKAMNALGA